MANPDKDGFTFVKGGRESKKRKADGSPLLHSPPGASSASPINTPACLRPSTYKNSVPIILSDVDPKFSSVVKLMRELRQFHPSLRVSKVQELKNNRFLVIGDTQRDVAIICGKSHHHKGCPNREKKQPKCANCKGLHVASYKGCPAYKKQAFRQHVVDNQKSYGAILCQNKALPQPQDKTFTFSAQQLVKFVANVAIQVAQPQVCYINPPPPPPRTQLTRSQVCVAEFQRLPKPT